MFERVEKKGVFLGYRLSHKHVLFFFGSKNLSRDGLYDLHPEFEFTFTKQVHGTKVVESSPLAEPEADGQFSCRATRAPVVVTADCLPLLLASKSQICAIHSGWRSAAGGILKASASHFVDEPVLFAAIGPHISKQSFEIGRDVAEQLRAALPTGLADQALELPHPDPNKVFFDLNALVRHQIQALWGPQVQIFDCSVDTKTSPDFCSYRRDGLQAGRQYSFVVINS